MDNSHSQARNNLAITLEKKGKADEAVEQYKMALTTNPKNPRILNNMGICVKKMGQTLQAAEYYKEAINVDPTYSLAHFNNGVILAENVFLHQTYKFIHNVGRI